MMLDKNYVLGWNSIEHTLYEEDGHIFGIELDLFNNHESYYYEKIKKYPYSDFVAVKEFEYLNDDIYKAIDQFNEKLEESNNK